MPAPNDGNKYVCQTSGGAALTAETSLGNKTPQVLLSPSRSEISVDDDEQRAGVVHTLKRQA